MKVTAGQLRDAREAMNNLAAQRLPIKAGYAVSRNARIVDQEYAPIHQKFVEIVRELGKPIEGQSDAYNIPEDKRVEANKLIDELFAIEIDCDLRTVSVDALGQAQLSGTECAALAFMLED